MKAPASFTVLGAGPAGYPAAFLAADLGLPVTLIDSAAVLGGTCLHHGCIPSKSLLHAARLLSDAREAAAIGIDFAEPAIRLDALRSWKKSVSRTLAEGLAGLAKARGIQVIQARAAFESFSSLELTDPNGDRTSHNFDRLLLATGSSPARIPGFKSRHPDIWNSTSALELPSIPESLLVIGGGYIGLEIGSIYAGLGSRVTIVEMATGLLPGVDRDLIVPLSKRLRSRFAAIYLNTRVVGYETEPVGLRFTLESLKTRKITELHTHKALIAVGRVPCTRKLNPEVAGIRLDDWGFIRADAYGQTDHPNVFAAGDVAGNPMLAHKATHEARAIVAQMLRKESHLSSFVPAVVFTDPEIAWCGLTQTQAKEQGIDVQVSKFPWAASGRALTLDRADGVTKILANPQTGKLLGVAIAGPGAGDLISEASLALETGATVADLARTIHPHPTLSETLGEAADLHEGLCTHLYRPNKD